MSVLLASRRSAVSAAVRQHILRSLSSTTGGVDPYYKPTLVERREGEGGPGGHASDAKVKVAVFGAGGHLGTHVCQELGSNGFMAYIANRGDDLELRHLKPCFELGRTRFVFYSPRDRESIKEVIADADVVVNLIGKRYETGQPVQIDKFPYIGYQTNYSYHDTNVMIPRTLAEICYEMQVDHFVHVSSASASPDSRSEWSRTKYEGEMAVKDVYPWATIIRPTQFFGRNDVFLNWYARMAQWYRMVPLVDGGKQCVTQPVNVTDVAKVVLAVCDAPKMFEGRRIDCFGPTDYTQYELAEFVNDITERNRPIINLPYDYYKMLAKVMQYTRDSLVFPDLVEQMSEDFLPAMGMEEYKNQPNDATKILTMADLGIQATPIEKEAFGYLQSYRTGGHFFRVQGYH